MKIAWMPGHKKPPNKPAETPVDLAREYERLSLSFKAMGGGLWDYDVTTDALYCNARWYEIMGRDPVADHIASAKQFKAWIHPQDVTLATEVDPVHATALLNRGDCYRVEFRILRPDGSVRWLRSVACIVVDRVTAHLRAIGCVTDISEFRADAPPPSGRDFATERMRSRIATLADAASTPAPGPQLTNKERNCLVWVCVGKSAWETAIILGVSQRTVEFHLNNATRKLDASNKIHAAFIAIKRGLLDLP